jgi:hypothetical protein
MSFSESQPYLLINDQVTDLLVQQMEVNSGEEILANNLETGLVEAFKSPTNVRVVAISSRVPDALARRGGMPAIGGVFVLRFRPHDHQEYEGAMTLRHVDMTCSPVRYTYVFEGEYGGNKIVAKSELRVSTELAPRRPDRWNLLD